MKRAILFFNGNFSDVKQAKYYLKPDDFIICADGAAEFALQLNIIPDVILGDFDSLPKSAQQKLRRNPSKWIRFPREKDETDSELAISFALEHKYKDLLIFGLFGSRIDHMLTNIAALERLTTQGIHAVCIEGRQEIQVTNNFLKLTGKVGELVSLIPLKGDAKQVTTRGLKYPLNNEDLLFGYSRGVSNVLSQNNADISVKNGSVLVIHYKRS
jgi:thiamine pyrophosphokinase